MVKDTLPLSVVIPVYNEGEYIRSTIDSLKKNISFKNEIIVIYDQDQDTTVPVLEEICLHDASVKMLKNDVEPGPSGAIRTGISYSSGNNILVTMADMSDDHTQINEMLNIMNLGSSIVIPSRYCKGGKQLLNKKSKGYMPRVAGRLLKFLSGLPTLDPTNSYKLYSRELISSVNLTSKVSFSVTLELVAKAHCLGLEIKEIPTTWKDRTQGKSNFSFIKSMIYYLPWFFLALLKSRISPIPKKTVAKFIRK